MDFDQFIHNLLHPFDEPFAPTGEQREAQARGERDRAAARAGDYGFRGSVLPEQVAQAMENFHGMSHGRIRQFVAGIDPGTVGETAASWTALANGISDDAAAFRDAVATEIGNGWSGATARAAQNSVESYLQYMGSLHDAAATAVSKINDANSTLNQVKYQVPEQPERTSIAGTLFDLVVGDDFLGDGFSLIADHGRATNAENAAREVMTTVYARYLPEADRNVPAMPAPPAAAADSGPLAQPQALRSAVDSTVPTGVPGSSQPGADAADPAAASSELAMASAANPNAANTNDRDVGKPMAASAFHGAPTDPAGLGPSSATVPSGMHPGGTPGFGSSAGHGPSGGGHPNFGVPGHSGRGGVVGNSPSTAGATRTGSSAGRSGSPAAPGMMPSAAPGKPGEDKEHHSPAYLRRIQEELLGPPIEAAPAVIGEDPGTKDVTDDAQRAEKR